MPRFTWTAKYILSGGGTYTITDIQAIQISWGLRNITDVWAPAKIVIDGRNPGQFTSVPIKIDQQLKVEMSSTSGTPTVNGKPMFYGYISDIAYNYDFVTNGDTWRIEGEGTSAKIGRKTGDATWTAGNNIEQAVEAFNPPVTVDGYNLGSEVSAQTFTDTQFGNLLGILLQMEQGAIGESNQTVRLYGRNYTAWDGFTWSDGTIARPDFIKYDNISFGSRAQNYSNKVIVSPQGLAEQSAGTGDRVFALSTYDQTTSQANDLANYLNASLILQEGQPIQISAVDYAQVNNYLSSMGYAPQPWSDMSIDFRGGFYQAYAIGGTISATPDGARFTFNLIPQSVKDFFILGSTSKGILGTSKLGF